MSVAKSESAAEVTRKAEKSIIKALVAGVGIGAIGLIGYPCTIAGVGARLMFIGFLLAVSAFITGFFTGTLFGMPKRNDEVNSDYSLNNSLVEISDWLTKIIVGLSLVNLKEIPKYLMSLGKYISEASGSTGQSLDIFSMCAVTYFSVFGLYIGYNYMRLVLSQKYKVADDNILRKELIKKDLEAEQLKSEIVEQKAQAQHLIQEVNQTGTAGNDFTAEEYVGEMRKKALIKFEEGLRRTPNDAQKDQWGKEARRNNRALKADVNELAIGVYRIHIKVISTDPEHAPLTEGETVLFALHQSFGQPPFRYVNVENGIAELRLFSYGSFTVGAFVDRGDTELELDLAELPGVSAHFRTH
jgi:hypothetical protein